MAYGTAITLALIAANAGLRASGALDPGAPPPLPAAPKKKGGMGGVPFHSKFGGDVQNTGGPPMIGQMGNTGAPDILGALSKRPTTGGPLGMLARGGSMGMNGGSPVGALSSGGMLPGLGGGPMGGGSPMGGGMPGGGGIDPATLQLILGGLNAGGGLLGGQDLGQVSHGFVNNSVFPALGAMRKPPMQPGGIQPGGGDQMAQILALLKSKGLLGDADGPAGPLGSPPGGPVPQIPPAGIRPYGMMGGYA